MIIVNVTNEEDVEVLGHLPLSNILGESEILTETMVPSWQMTQLPSGHVRTQSRLVRDIEHECCVPLSKLAITRGAGDESNNLSSTSVGEYTGGRDAGAQLPRLKKQKYDLSVPEVFRLLWWQP